MGLVISKGLTLRKGWQPMDPDAAAYITAVETADGQALEEKTKIAIDNFVLGCKADGIWTAIKASCILAGARTLNGALVSLVGTAPTNFNFVSGDYNRKTGLVGDGSTKYLNSNRAGNADPQNSFHLSTYSTTAHDPVLVGTAGGASIGNGSVGTTGANNLGVAGGAVAADHKTFSRSRNDTADFLIGPGRASITFQGQSRSSVSEYVVRVGGANYTQARSSQTPLSTNIFVFGRNNAGALELPVIGRLAFYSIGESLDLALLDARVTDLINAFGAAIP
jgi:hypothetical protein